MGPLSRREPSALTRDGLARDRVIESALRLLEAGATVADLSIVEIAADAGVSRPTFYTYFRDKRDLVLALGDRFERRTQDAAQRWLTMVDDEVADALRAVLEVFRAERTALRAILEAAGYDPEAAAFWRRFHEGFIQSVIDRAYRTGTHDAATQADAFVLVWMTERAFTEHIQAPRVSDDMLIESLQRFWRTAM